MRRFAICSAPACVAVLASLTGLAALLPLAGCESSPQNWNDGTAPRADRAGGSLSAGQSLDPTALREMGWSVRWIYQLRQAGGGGVTEFEVLDDLLVAVEGPDNMVTAIKVDAGQYAWKVLIGQNLESLYRPLRDGDRVFINSAARFYTLDADTGRVQGNADLDAPVSAGAVLINDLAIFGAAAGTAYGHDVDAGYAKWRYRMRGRLLAPPIASGDNVFLADEAGTYAMLDAASGDLVFRNAVFGPVTTQPTVHRGDILVPSQDRSLYALNRATGNESWVYRASHPLNQSPLSVGRDIYLPAEDGGVIALDSAGAERWTSPLHATPVMATDEGVYAVANNALVLMDPDTGAVTRSVRFSGAAQGIPGPDGSLILRSDTGRIVRLDPIN